MCTSPSASASMLALHALQNASADVRLHQALCAADVGAALRTAACTLPPSAAAIARGALSNIEQLSWMVDDLTTGNGVGSPQAAPCPPDVDQTFTALPQPPPPPDAASGDAPVGVGGVSHRALPPLCQQLREWNSLGAKRRGVQGLSTVLSARSLDAATALELLRRGDTVACVLDLLYPPGSAAAAQLASAGAGGVGGGKIGPSPSQTDVPLRDGCLHLLGLIAHLGGSELLTPLPRIAAALGGALVASEPSVRAHAAAFWRAASVWAPFAAALVKLIFPLGAVRSAGVTVDATNSSFTNGLNVLLGLANNPHHPHPLGGAAPPPDLMTLGVHASVQLESAACALAHILQHDTLDALWTSAPDTLAYLIKLDDEAVGRLIALPAQMRAAKVA